MPYEFDMPYLRGLLTRRQQEEEDEAKQALNQLMTPQQQSAEQPLPTEQPEQRDGKDMVNAAIENAFRPAPNPYEIGLQRGVTAQKQAYGDAQDDAGRQMASSTADLLRNKAAAAGIDMSGYGSDVPYSDAYNNLASREAQDIMEALQGQYSMNSDQYYTKTYNALREQGYSVGRSKRVAGDMAREYQANRVAYLQGAYNSYGHDGRVTNDYGNMFLGMMAMENPTLANFYSQVYPTQKDAYNQENLIARDMLQNNNLLERLGIMQQYEIDNTNLKNKLNKDYAEFNAGLSRGNYAANKAVDEQYSINVENRKEEAAGRAYQKRIEQGELLAERWGFTGEEAQRFKAAWMGIPLPNPQTGKVSNKVSDDELKNLHTLHQMLGSRIQALTNQLKNSDDGMKPDPTIALALADAIRSQQDLENIYGGVLGIKGVGGGGVAPYSDNDALNNQSLAKLWQLSSGDMNLYRENVDRWLTQSGVTVHFKEQYLKNLKPFEEGKK